MISCTLILICTGLAILFLTCSQSPGIEVVATKLLPLNFGYQRMFNISDEAATWLAIPATYATGFGFMWVYGRQMSSMAKSGLLPAVFKRSTKDSNTPYVALAYGSLTSFVIVLLSKYCLPALQESLYFVCCLSSYLVYLNAFIGFIVFRTKYSSVSRHFVNPFGIPSAVIGMIIFTTAFISVVGFQDGHYESIIIFIVVLILLSIYYFVWVSATQQYSDDEQKALFTAYIINGKSLLFPLYSHS
jgi:ethanolamine permease